MKKLYVVTIGEYSDYCISAIFESKELAQAYIDKFSDFNTERWRACFNDVEEYILNPHADNLLTNRNPVMVEMKKNGDVVQVRKAIRYDYPNYNGLVDYTHGYIGDTLLNMRMVVFADDEKHAIKIVNEKRAQIIAMDRWGINEE